MLALDFHALGKYERLVRRDVPLSGYSFALCGGEAAGLIMPDNAEMLAELGEICLEKELPFRVFGGLSNVLVSDSGYNGLIILNRNGRIETQDETGLIDANSGMMMSAIVSYCEENGWSGLEWAAGLPGTLGGAVVGNAGAFGSEISGCLVSADLLDETGTRRKTDGAELAFSYRDSALKRGSLHGTILDVCLQLQPADSQSVQKRGQINREKRTSTQPRGAGSLGSVFRNPTGVSAGKLIENAGLKGVSVGQAQISTLHANFIITRKGVRSQDYKTLMDLVRQKVLETSGILLEPEIEMIGF